MIDSAWTLGPFRQVEDKHLAHPQDALCFRGGKGLMARRFMVEDRGQVSFVHRLAASPTGVEMSALQGRLAAQALTDMTKSGIEHGSLLLLAIRRSAKRYGSRHGVCGGSPDVGR